MNRPSLAPSFKTTHLCWYSRIASPRIPAMSVLRTLFTVVALAALVSADANLFRALLDNNKCLTVKGNVNKNGSPVVISDCSGTTGQLWAVVDVGNPADDNFQLQISPWNKCLDVTDGIDKNGQRPQIWECRTETIQTKFSTILGMISNPADNTFVWAVGNKCLDITDGKVTNGNAVCREFMQSILIMYSLLFA
jgi:hypothetical protein